MTLDDINAALREVHYPDYNFFARESGGRMYIQASFLALDHSAEHGFQFVEEQCTRKWYVSNEATKSEVIQTALKLILTAVEHEAREAFKYRGRAVFGPHINVDVLHEVCGFTEGRESTPAVEEEELVPG